MCDSGRTMYQHLNLDTRITGAKLQGKSAMWPQAFDALKAAIAQHQEFQIILNPQLTNEEYADILNFVSKIAANKKVSWFVWRPENEKPSDFDGILRRGDHNANTAGMETALKNAGVEAATIRKASEIPSNGNAMRLVFGPEVETSYTESAHHDEGAQKFAEMANAICEGSKTVFFGNSKLLNSKLVWMQIPTFVFAEKDGSLTNYSGKKQFLKSNPPILPTIKPLNEVFAAVGAV
jgi:NADH-quinone oxidoreductase subunit G